jgi:hypothetical protein
MILSRKRQNTASQSCQWQSDGSKNRGSLLPPGEGNKREINNIIHLSAGFFHYIKSVSCVRQLNLYLASDRRNTAKYGRRAKKKRLFMRQESMREFRKCSLEEQK